MTTTQTFSIERARAILGYEPVLEPERQWREILTSYGLSTAKLEEEEEERTPGKERRRSGSI